MEREAAGESNKTMSLTDDQLTRALAFINYPAIKHSSDPRRRLEQLILYFASCVSFGTVGLHYSPEHRISLDLDDLFYKIIVLGKGGYCVELNGFFAYLLRSLGYTVLTCAARVRGPGEKFLSWTHMCLIITLNGVRYLVDVGFGADAPLQPVPLVDGYEFSNLAPRRGRLQWRSLKQHTDPSQRLWVYSTQQVEGSLWCEQYVFTEIEYFHADYETMNYFTSTNPNAWFTHTLIATRVIIKEDEQGARAVAVRTMVGSDVRQRNIDSLEKVNLATLKTEAERIAALENYFGISLVLADREGIYTTVASKALVLNDARTKEHL